MRKLSLSPHIRVIFIVISIALYFILPQQILAACFDMQNGWTNTTCDKRYYINTGVSCDWQSAPDLPGSVTGSKCAMQVFTQECIDTPSPLGGYVTQRCDITSTPTPTPTPAPQCTTPSDCPAPANIYCQTRTCTSGTCGVANNPYGTACPNPNTGIQDGTAICNGQGSCLVKTACDINGGYCSNGANLSQLCKAGYTPDYNDTSCSPQGSSYLCCMPSAPTPTPTPTPPPPTVPCSVTTSPTVYNLSIGGAGTVTASVTSGQGSATISQMRFGSYNTSIATVNPTSDSTSIYSTTVTAIAGGVTAVWGTADLSDGRTCQSSGTTDTDIHISGPTPTPTPIPTPAPGNKKITVNVYVDTNTQNGVKDAGEGGYANAGLALSGDAIAQGSTNATGQYVFYEPPGTYSVTLTVPPNYNMTPANPTNPVTGLTLPPDKTVNFGIVPITTPTPTPIIIPAPPPNAPHPYFMYTPISTPTPTPTPTPVPCTGCQSPNGAGGCWDDDFNCPVGQYCKNGTCGAPPAPIQLTNVCGTPMPNAMYGTWGYVYIDKNGNQVFNQGEKGVANASISINTGTDLSNLNTYVGAASTNQNGCYSFFGLPKKAYMVTTRVWTCKATYCFQNFQWGPYCYVPSTSQTNSSITNSFNPWCSPTLFPPPKYCDGPTFTQQACELYSYPYYQNVLGSYSGGTPYFTQGSVYSVSWGFPQLARQDFGLYQYSFTVSVFVDDNRNGIKDPGERNYGSGILVSASSPGVFSFASQFTDPAGRVVFDGAPAGTYNFSLSNLPSGYLSTTALPLAVLAGQNVQVDLGIAPGFTIEGDVFADSNKNTLKDGGETNYSGTITIASAGGTVSYPSAGSFKIDGLSPGTYTISYTNLPTGFQMTEPKNGPPPSFVVTVGSPCSVGSSKNASCDPDGNIINLHFGITNSIPWIQSKGINIRNDRGFTNPIPSSAISSCGGAYASLSPEGGMPGIIFSGDKSYDFGGGQASVDPYNWVVGGTTFPEIYNPSQGNVIKTSYSYQLGLAQDNGLVPTDIANSCGGSIASCTLSSSLVHGLYIANGNLTLTGSPGGKYNFPNNQNYVILVDGDLRIAEEISVPNGSTATFSVSGNIYVDKGIGESNYKSDKANIEGFYSTDKSFIVEGTNDCTISSDKRLNIAGSVITNASLSGGSFHNQRDLCSGNLECPVFSIHARPDFILNAPDIVKQKSQIWREDAP